MFTDLRQYLREFSRKRGENPEVPSGRNAVEIRVGVETEYPGFRRTDVVNRPSELAHEFAGDGKAQRLGLSAGADEYDGVRREECCELRGRVSSSHSAHRVVANI